MIITKKNITNKKKQNYFTTPGLKLIIFASYLEVFLNCSMNKENASKLWKIIQEAGDYLRD